MEEIKDYDLGKYLKSLSDPIQAEKTKEFESSLEEMWKKIVSILERIAKEGASRSTLKVGDYFYYIGKEYRQFKYPIIVNIRYEICQYLMNKCKLTNIYCQFGIGYYYGEECDEFLLSW